jgi:hypothetical protein
MTAWATKPTPPSLVLPGIPVELDALVMSLLSLEPALRPRTAFEVMQRLAGLARLQGTEPLAVSQAYLATPVMVGREAPLSEFRAQMQSAIGQRGGGFLIEGGAGLGRSRLLDACALEAKTLGAVVLRARANGQRSVAFSAIPTLADQLTWTLPDHALETARDHGVFAALFDQSEQSSEQAAFAHGPSARVWLKRLSGSHDELSTLRSALSEWFLRTSRRQPILIAVDDADGIDARSLALLASLAHEARHYGLLVAATIGGACAADSLHGQRRLPHTSRS